MAIFPYSGTFIMAALDGKTLRLAFEHCVKGFNFTKRHGKFLQVSGISSFY